MFRLGYNSNGLAHHRPLDALRLIAELGYEGLALTPDVGTLDPYELSRRTMADMRMWSDDQGIEITIETGARFLLDARRKHYPTLLEETGAERMRRVNMLRLCIDMAVILDAKLVSIWSGAAPDGLTCEPQAGEDAEAAVQRERHWETLCSGLRTVIAHAEEHRVGLAFEPEPGMFIERPQGYAELIERLGDDADRLGLCLDVGHLLVTGDLPVEKSIHTWAHRLTHVHLDDIADGVHEHRMFGTGNLDLSATLKALIDVGYNGMAAVELSRDSHRGAQAASEAMSHLRAALAESPRH